MQLDKSKKYEFCGEVYEWDGEEWESDYITVRHLQYFANRQLVKEALDIVATEVVE